MPDELTCNCRELKQRRFENPSPSPGTPHAIPPARKVFYNCLGEWGGVLCPVLCSLGTSAGDFKLQNFYILPTFYASFWQPRKGGQRVGKERERGREQEWSRRRKLLRTRFVVADVLARAFLATVLIIIVMIIIIIISRACSFPRSLPLFLSFCLCLPVIYIVMLRIFDRKRMLLLICMSDSGLPLSIRW